MSSLLNPLLMKESTGSNQYGPLQIHASTYNLWKLDYIFLKLTPMVGSSAVSGTAVRASLDLSGQPGTPSWSALGARKHKDTSPGRQMTFYLSGNDLKGPKEGWFYCNTKNDPKMCIAGAVQIHTLGKTMSTFTNTPFDGPLFLVELTGQWSFKNYNPQPGLLNLVKTEIKEDPQDIKIHSKPGEPILISIPDNTSMARAITQVDVNADATPSEIIWQICDAALDAAAGAFPPPFTWLFKCGWWFVKRIANRNQGANDVPGVPNPGELTFQVYQSINDAQNEVPCISTADAKTTNTTINHLQLMQITPGNTGMQQETLAGLQRMAPLTLDPIQIVSTPLTGQTAFYGHIFSKVPNACVVAQQVGGTNAKVYSYSIWPLNRPIFLQNGNSIDPAQIDSNYYPIYCKEGQRFTQIGNVYAAGNADIGNPPDNYHWTTSLWRATKTMDVKLQGTAQRSDRFVFIQPTQGHQPTSFPATTYTLQVTDSLSLQQPVRTVSIVEGEWYLSSFVNYGGAVEFTNYNVPYYFGLRIPDTLTSVYEISQAVFDVGAAMQTTAPVVLRPPSASAVQTLTALEVAQLRQLIAPRNDYSPSEYDNLEMSPLEGEEEEEQGATGGYTPLEGARQQRVRGPQCIPIMGAEDNQPLLEETEEEDDEDYESDLDDDDYAEVPSLLKYLLTPEAKSLCDDLKRKGLDHDVAVKAAQVAFPHPAKNLWEATYHNALVDGLSPPSARDLAWGAISEYI